MAKPAPDVGKRIETHFDEAPGGVREICKKLRRIVFKAEPEIVEDWKWGPNYSKNGMVCGIGVFQKHASLAFFQGAHMKDPKRLFIKEDVPAKNMRRIRFIDPGEVHEPTIASYIKEAVALNTDGVATSKRTPDIPADLNRALARNKRLSGFFGSLSYTHQKEYVRWVESAKKEETRKARIMKSVEMLARKIKHP
jgi:uncharacterized protein YdeI (YjbR/CyaY-like superfamily)